MSTVPELRLSGFFRGVVAKRYWVIAFYALLMAPAAYFALGVEQDNGIDRLIVRDDPDYLATREFEKTFGSGEYAVVIAEAKEPFRPEVLARVQAIETALAKVPKVAPTSALDIFARVNGGFVPNQETAQAFRRFIEGSKLVAQQAPIGKDFIAVPIVLDVHSQAERRVALQEVDRALAPFSAAPAPLIDIHHVGLPFVVSYLDDATTKGGARYGTIMILFIVILTVSIFRSWRTLLAFIIALGVTVTLTMGFIGVVGGTFTIVSSMVPVTVIITCLSNLVYVHSRFVERPPERSVEDHQIFSLADKFLACSASIWATAVGFFALMVSQIRPIREMGSWVAVGVLFTWLVVFTLFPALQRVLHTPSGDDRRVAGAWVERWSRWIPRMSYHYRALLLTVTLILPALGAVALFGIPGKLASMQLETDSLEYITHHSPLYISTKRFAKELGGLSITSVWLKGPKGSMATPQVLAGIDAFAAAMEKEPGVGEVIAPTSLLRMVRYIGGKGDAMPHDEAGLEEMSAQLDELLLKEPTFRRFVEPSNLAEAQIAVVSNVQGHEGFAELQAMMAKNFAAVQKTNPGLAQITMKPAGLAAMQAKISFYLVPTLVESFGLTMAIIFFTFLLVFRSGAARVMAMLPSLFAILVMFGIMRLTHMSLNVATILIASTVLGASENDQVHFFYHFSEHRKVAGVEESLAYALRVAGRAIFFSTLINAGGFLAFALSDLPPIRQFGTLAAIAFTLSMIADFTALPAALWVVFRARPESLTPPSLPTQTSPTKT
jgi:predicted RND superfamily exporter protein